MSTDARMYTKSWNERHNSEEKQGTHTYKTNWQIAALPIKVHPSQDYCRHGGLDCQYLGFDDANEPLCKLNLEFRGDPKAITKQRLQKCEGSSDIQKAPLCKHACRNARYWYGGTPLHTFENTSVELIVETPKEGDDEIINES